MGLLVIGFLSALAAALAATLIGAAVWAMAAAYVLGGVLGIVLAARPREEVPHRRDRPALTRP